MSNLKHTDLFPFSFSSLTHSFTAFFHFHLLLIQLPHFFVFISYSFIYRIFSFSSLTHSITAFFRFHLLLIHLPHFFVFISYSFIYRIFSFSSLTHSFTSFSRFHLFLIHLPLFFVFISYSFIYRMSSSSYITYTMDIICSGCCKTIKTKNTVCENCLKYYHPSCTALTQVRKNDKLFSACRTCIT